MSTFVYSPDINSSRVLEAGQEQLWCTIPPCDHILGHEVLLRAAPGTHDHDSKDQQHCKVF